MTNKKWLLLIVILALGFLLRATAFFHYPLTNDYAVHWGEAHRLLEGKLVLVGPAVTSQGDRGLGFYQGPFYYYYLALLQFLTGSNDRLVVLLFGLINSLAIIPFFFICRRLFSEKTAWWLTSIYAINPYLVYVDGTPWNPNLIPALTTWSLLVSLKIKADHRCEFLPTLYCLLAFISQCHLLMTPLILFFVIFTFDWHVFQKKLWLYLSGILLFLFLWSPWFVYQIQNSFTSFSSFGSMASIPAQKCDIVYYLQHHGHGERCFHYIRNPLAVMRTFVLQILGTQNLPLASLGLLFFVGCLIYMWRRQDWGYNDSFKYFSFAILLIIFTFLFYRSYIYRQYFLSVIPFGLLFLGFWMSRLRCAKWISLMIVLSNLYFLWWTFSTMSFAGFYT